MSMHEEERFGKILKEELETVVFEEVVLFFSVIKWIVLATVVGILVGLSTTFFLKVLDMSVEFHRLFTHYYLALPIAILLSRALIKYIAPEAEGHGTEKVIEAIHKRSGRIDIKVVPVKLLATVITLTAGGSVGKEGPAAQIGAGISSAFAGLLRFNDTDRKKLVVCGISAGFASIFGTPISGALFGMEVLFLGSLMYEVILPSFVSGIVAYQTAKTFGISYEYFPLSFYVPSITHFLTYSVLAGIFFGVVAVIFIEVLRLTETFFRKLKTSDLVKPLIGGALLVVLTLIFSDDYLGLGLDRIHDALVVGDARPYDFILKTIFTSLTLASGGSGGIVTPLFFVGSTSGVLFADLFNQNSRIFAALGFVGVLSGAANTPISASVMAIEIFGPKIGPYAAVVSVISFLITGHRSVYPSQRIGMRKSPSVEVEIGAEVEDVRPVVRPSGLPTALRLYRRLRLLRRGLTDAGKRWLNSLRGRWKS
ncbi:MAG: voltage-gated chloride channel [Thermotogae bacterium]|nr:voltage-gated chloride channel [Thermotogota bacterium]